MAALRLRRRKPKGVLPWLGLGLVLFFLLLNVIPYSQPFEGVLQVKKLSFTSSQAQPFLSLVAQQVTLSGASSEDGSEFRLPLQLGGSIQSKQVPALNTQSSLAIELTGSDRFSMAAPGLGISLRLTPQTRIQLLSFDSQTQELSFSLLPGHQTRPTLEIQPPAQSLKIDLSRASALKSSRIAQNEPLNFTLTTSEFGLAITTPTKIRLKLLSLPADPFQQALQVKTVDFQEQLRSSFSDLATRHSTLLGGKLRLGKAEPFELSPDQFLTIQPPGIQELSYIRIQSPQSPKENSAQTSTDPSVGLQLGVAGKTSDIQAGLSRRYPVISFSPSVLSGWLTPTQLASVNGFLVGVAAAFVQEFIAFWLSSQQHKLANTTTSEPQEPRRH